MSGTKLIVAIGILHLLAIGAGGGLMLLAFRRGDGCGHTHRTTLRDGEAGGGIAAAARDFIAQRPWWYPASPAMSSSSPRCLVMTGRAFCPSVRTAAFSPRIAARR